MRIDKALLVTLLMPTLAILGLVWLGSSGGGLSRVFVAASIAGTIGTLVDWMAVVMVFERKWWLPFSGVIPRNKEAICEDIAHLVETQWFTPTALAAHLEEVDLKPHLQAGLREVFLSKDVQRELRALLSRAAMERLDDPNTESYFSEQAGRALKQGLGRLPGPLSFLSRGAVELGLLDVLDLPGKAGRAVLESTRVALKGALDKGDLERVLREETERLIPVLVNPSTERAIKRAMVDVFTHSVKVGELVRRHLARMSSEDVRDMVASKAKTHLDWIRVNGAIGGFAMGALFESVRLVLAL